MMNRLKKYANYQRFVEGLLTLGGLGSTIKTDVNECKVVSTMALLACVSMTCFFINFCILHISELNFFITGISFVGSYICVTLKMTIFMMWRSRIRDLTKTLNLLFDDSFKKEYSRSLLLSSIYNFYRPAYIYFTIMFTAFVFQVITPLIFVGIQINKGVERIRCILPLPAAYPWLVRGCGLIYQLHYSYQVFAHWFVVFVSCGVDLLFGNYVLRISGLLRTASYDIQNSKQDWNIICQVIANHATIMKSCETLQMIYGPIVFIMILTSAVIICAISFQAYQTTMTVGKVFLFAFLIGSKLTQAYIYSWYGTTITTESENFSTAVYCSNWEDTEDIFLMKNINILLLQRPIKLTACKFFYISLDMFVGILNTTLSYFFLLKTLDETS